MNCPHCKRYIPRRTVPQNSRLFKIIRAIAQQTGNEVDDVYDACKDMFLPRRVVQLSGTPRVLPGRGSEQTKAEFSDFSAQVEAWAVQELGVDLSFLDAATGT